MTKAEWFLQEDIKKIIRGSLGKEPWITVYQNAKNDNEDMFFYSALIPNGETDEVLDKIEFDFSFPYFGIPSTETDSENINQALYLRFGVSSGLEPLVLVRDFHGVKPSYTEVSQEFIHFHNLYHDVPKNRYIKISDDGREEEVITVSDSEIKVKLKYVKQYLAFKDMSLGIYFETTRFINENAEDIGLLKEGDNIDRREDLYHFGFWYRNEDFSSNKKAFSRMLGKKIITGMRKEDTGIYPFEEERLYQEFIFGQDANGRDAYFTCNPDKLANFFGKNPDAPLYVTPVSFSKEVLHKYYDDPEKFLVEDGYLRCGGLWGLHMDNHHDDYVIVLLGDLGYLSHAEQMYWKSFNIPPAGGFSEAIFKRFFLAEFADPETVDLVFKNTFVQMQEKWATKFGWSLFKSLNEGDEYHFTGLRVPLKNTQIEFDSQILSLTKVIIDSLNEQEIRKNVVEDISSLKGISKLEKYLESNGYKDYVEHIKFLRSLQELRSTGSAHRKSDNYLKAAHEFGLDKNNFIEVFTEILKQVIVFLDYLDSIL
ncbi:MAG: hypothetical protein HOP27_17100 [Anaerolineales bacterium]|nr:hypothetical protein [Anaerolineales bacterium]